MSVYALDIGWAQTANDLRYLQWELLTCDEVRGVFRTEHEQTLTVLFAGDRDRFRAWVRSLTSRQGALG